MPNTPKRIRLPRINTPWDGPNSRLDEIIEQELNDVIRDLEDIKLEIGEVVTSGATSGDLLIAEEDADGTITFRPGKELPSSYTIEGDLTVKEDVTVSGAATVVGSVGVSGGVTVSGTVTASGNIVHKGVTLPKHNLTATAAPTTGDDTGDDYAEGSVWVNTTLNQVYICADATSGAAVWRQVSTPDLHSFRQVGTSPFERWYIPGMLTAGTLTSGDASVVDQIRALPLLTPRGGTVDKVSLNVTSGAASGVCRLGIYKSTSATNLYPSALVWDSGEIDVSTSGVITVTGSISLEPNTLYWVTYLFGTAIPKVRLLINSSVWAILGLGTDMGANPGMGFYHTQSYGALPDPFPSGSATVLVSTNNVPAIGVHFSA